MWLSATRNRSAGVTTPCNPGFIKLKGAGNRLFFILKLKPEIPITKTKR